MRAIPIRIGDEQCHSSYQRGRRWVGCTSVVRQAGIHQWVFLSSGFIEPGSRSVIPDDVGLGSNLLCCIEETDLRQIPAEDPELEDWPLVPRAWRSDEEGPNEDAVSFGMFLASLDGGEESGTEDALVDPVPGFTQP